MSKKKRTSKRTSTSSNLVSKLWDKTLSDEEIFSQVVKPLQISIPSLSQFQPIEYSKDGSLDESLRLSTDGSTSLNQNNKISAKPIQSTRTGKITSEDAKIAQQDYRSARHIQSDLSGKIADVSAKITQKGDRSAKPLDSELSRKIADVDASHPFLSQEQNGAVVDTVDFEPAELDSKTKRSGFRLSSFEVYNWGTFNHQVWRLNLNGNNALLTGEIGSGKSTFVDAITTLLYPSHRAAYNKAAGADAKERTLRSYVLGHYKSGRNESENNSKPVALRDNNSYSVILGVFHNADFNQTVTLAQVFWMKDPTAAPARFYVAAEKELSINGDFDKFGAEMTKLTKRLRNDGCEIFDSFSNYGAWFRRRFGIGSEQAMDLFHQTISMKSVGNLTEFVRNHMLEITDVEARLEALIQHFDDLNSAHESVLRAELQIKMLTPIVADCQKSIFIKQRCDELRACREALRCYFANLKLDLVSKQLTKLNDDWNRSNVKVEKLEQSLDTHRIEERRIERQIAENGGDRIAQLKDQIRQKNEELDKRKQKYDRYCESIRLLNLVPASDSSSFSLQTAALIPLREQYQAKEADLQNELNELTMQLRQKRDEHSNISEEITSLKARRSNIPRAQVSIRALVCDALKLSEDDLPFAGELLKVREEDQEWEGAAERALRNFGLSLLVPDDKYAAVADWVDLTHLRDRLVYFRIRVNQRRPDFAEFPASTSLAAKVAIKPDSSFYDWLERELSARFKHTCCETQEEFRRQTTAITRSGQMKTPGERHEKDDRHHLNDRSRYVLGWSNAAKIEALENKLRVLEAEIGKLAAKISALQNEQYQLKNSLNALVRLEGFRDFEELDWQSIVLEIDKLQKEKEELESASDMLKMLTEQLISLQTQLKKTDEQAKEERDHRSKLEVYRAKSEEALKDLEIMLQDPLNQAHRQQFEKLDLMRFEALEGRNLSVDSCQNREHEMREWLQRKIDAEDRKFSEINRRVQEAMLEYKHQFPLETQDVDANVDSYGEFATMFAELTTNDLPRFKSRFKEMLNENAINEVANFQSQLIRERESIKERISHINKSLVEIKFTTDTFIVLEATLTQDNEIRDFQRDLRSCTEGTLTGSDDEEYSEAKFLEVKQIIERFRGRQGTTELDKRWTDRVTDVRNWFSFAASERWVEDGTEKEHYSDSSGKSGGQKEKLAYTILAASLAYQFGLEIGVIKSRTFRFVVIDEAFGKGSEDSANYGLSLFGKLGLQLLVVTPLQKIKVIEPYVNSVGFVHNNGGNDSQLRNMTIEECKEEQAAHLARGVDLA